MAGQPSLEIDLSDLPCTACVTDIVYSPRKTELLTQAAEKDIFVVDGIGMLLHQARPGFEAWFGRAPHVTAKLRNHMLDAVQG
jgi:shikimate dehydrogenase